MPRPQIDSPQEEQEEQSAPTQTKQDITATHSDREIKQEQPKDPNTEEGKKDQERNRQYKVRCQAMFQSSSESRRRYDWDWLSRDLYRRGYHFSRYNPSNRTVVLSSRSTVKIPINLLWAQMRTIKNQVTSFKPKWETTPKGSDEQAVTNARYSGKLLDVIYDTHNLRKLIKETVIQGLIYSIGGPWQIGYDQADDNGEGNIFIWLLDPYDFYIDPHATSLETAEFCIKAVRKPLDEITKNPEYSFFEKPKHGEMKIAASEYKQFLLQALKYQAQFNSEESEGAILYECWQKIRVGDENREELTSLLKESDEDTTDLRDGEVIMRVVTYLDFLIDPIKVQHLRRSDYPFVIYQADVNPLEIYGESWAKHVIPMNRVLDALESSVFQYNYKYGKGRIVVDKNSGVRIVTNEHGDIIEKNQGAEVTSLPLQPLPTSYQEQIENMRRYIEDVGGAHDISFGRIPTGIKSGIGIAEMKQADSTNSADLSDNLEDFLISVGKKILKEIANNFDVPKMINTLGKDGKPEHFMVVGEKAAKNRKNSRNVKIGTDVFNIAVIGAENKVTVKIGSWLAYTKDAQLDKLKELYQAEIIDQQTFLENAEFPDVQLIIERSRKEQILKKMRGTPAQGEAQVFDEEIAEQENIMMVNEGRQDITPQPQDNHQIHLIIHQDFADNPLVSQHMKQHEEMAANPRPSGLQPATQGPFPQQQTGPDMGMENMGGMPPMPSQAGIPPLAQGVGMGEPSPQQPSPPLPGGTPIPPIG